ncbi:hypothetical protein GQ457_09G013230 [Hibiscus cannabinus]
MGDIEPIMELGDLMAFEDNNNPNQVYVWDYYVLVGVEASTTAPLNSSVATGVPKMSSESTIRSTKGGGSSSSLPLGMGALVVPIPDFVKEEIEVPSYFYGACYVESIRAAWTHSQEQFAAKDEELSKANKRLVAKDRVFEANERITSMVKEIKALRQMGLPIKTAAEEDECMSELAHVLKKVDELEDNLGRERSAGLEVDRFVEESDGYANRYEYIITSSSVLSEGIEHIVLHHQFYHFLSSTTKAMEVTIKGSTIVRPAQNTPKRSLWNSNLDILTRYHVPTVYYYKPNGCCDFFDTGRLKESLSQILVPFYPIAGRLGYDENGRLEISCNAQGVLFVEAETSSVMDHLIGDFSDSSQVFRLVPEVDYSGGISSFPLLVVQVTKFKCGGVCFGVGFQHTLGDGASALHFINSWADTARGSSPDIAPFIDRTLLRARVPPTVKFHHVEHDPPPSMKSHSDDPKPCIVSTFKLTADQLNTLQAKANANSAIKYSTFKILAAHLWRCISKARGISGDQSTKLHFPVDGRFRLNPPLPPGYFGKAVFVGAIVSQAGDLESESFTHTIQRIHEHINQINDEYLRSALDYLENVSDLSMLNRGPHSHRCPNLVIIPWNRFSIYDADFGWGRPVYMGPGDIVREGKVYILPTPTNDGSLYVVTCLETSHMKLFEKLLYDFYFIQH